MIGAWAYLDHDVLTPNGNAQVMGALTSGRCSHRTTMRSARTPPSQQCKESRAFQYRGSRRAGLNVSPQGLRENETTGQSTLNLSSVGWTY